MTSGPSEVTVIRDALEADVPALVEMACRFVDETVYRSLLIPDPDAMTALARSFLNEPDRALLVAERDGQVIGMIGLMVYRHPMSGQRAANEIVWWVNPEQRGCGVRLLRAAEAWAKDRGATVIQMIAPSPDVEVLYERLLYRPVERTYQRRL